MSQRSSMQLLAQNEKDNPSFLAWPLNRFSCAAVQVTAKALAEVLASAFL